MFRVKWGSFFITKHRVCQVMYLEVLVQESQTSFHFTFRTAEQLYWEILTLVRDTALNLSSKMLCSFTISLQNWNYIICTFGYLHLLPDRICKLLGFLLSPHCEPDVLWREICPFFFLLFFPSKLLMSSNADWYLDVMKTVGALKVCLLSRAVFDLLLLWGSRQNRATGTLPLSICLRVTQGDDGPADPWAVAQAAASKQALPGVQQTGWKCLWKCALALHTMLCITAAVSGSEQRFVYHWILFLTS